MKFVGKHLFGKVGDEPPVVKPQPQPQPRKSNKERKAEKALKAIQKLHGKK
jgi:hypothetical protein